MSNHDQKFIKTKVGLSKQVIVATALNMIEENGIEQFSVRKLAMRLSCEPMSLYYHVKNKDQIFDEIVDNLISRIQFDQPSHSAQQQLFAIAQQWRKLAKTYPNFFPILAIHQLNTDIGSNFMNQLLNILVSAGLELQQATYGLRILNYYLMGAGIDEAKGYSLGNSAVEPIQNDELALKYPQLFQAMPYWKIEHQDHIFDLGLNMLLSHLLPQHK